MIANNPQQIAADLLGAQAEHDFEMWRGWAAEHEVEMTERRLREGETGRDNAWRAHLSPPLVSRRGWASGGVLLIASGLLWALLILLVRLVAWAVTR